MTDTYEALGEAVTRLSGDSLRRLMGVATYSRGIAKWESPAPGIAEAWVTDRPPVHNPDDSEFWNVLLIVLTEERNRRRHG